MGLFRVGDALTKCLRKSNVIQVSEKYLANGIDVLCVFMDLKKAYDTIDQHGMW